MQTNTIPAGGIAHGNRHYHNSQTIYSKWDERTSVVRPLIFLFVLEDKGEKNRGDYVNFCFGYMVSGNYTIMYTPARQWWPAPNVPTKDFLRTIIVGNIFVGIIL